MTEGNGDNPDVVLEQQDTVENVQKPSELEHVFVIILIGMLGIGAFVYIAFGEQIKRVLPQKIHVEDVAELNNQDYDDLEGRNESTLGLSFNKEVGRYYTHPDSGMTLYIYLNGECEGDCLENWEPYLAGDVDTNDQILGLRIRDDLEAVQYALLGNGLYTYKNDIYQGDMFGDGFDSLWEIARP